MRYIITKLIQETPEYHMEFRGSKLFDSIEAVQQYCIDEYNREKDTSRVFEEELVFDESALGLDNRHGETCCCKVCETMRYGKPYAMFFIDKSDPKYDSDSVDITTILPSFIGQYIKYYITVLTEEENQNAYEVLLKQHELHTGLNIENCFIKTVQLGNFTAVYDNMDHGYLDLELMIENKVSTSVLEKAQYPFVDLKLRIFVETVMSEKQQELFHVLRGFRMDIRNMMKRIQENPDLEVGKYCCNFAVNDNKLKLNYKSKSGGGCTHRPAMRIRYQWIKNEV